MPADSRVPRHQQITLPASVREELRVEQGDLVEIEVTNDRAVLMRQKSVDDSQLTSGSGKRRRRNLIRTSRLVAARLLTPRRLNRRPG